MTKVGRNDPCPCGSGKKYKSCCLSKKAPSKRTFKAKVLSSSNPVEVDKGIDLMERAFGSLKPKEKEPSDPPNQESEE